MQLTRANTAAGGSVQGYFATLRSALQQGPGTLFIGALGIVGWVFSQHSCATRALDGPDSSTHVQRG